MVIRWRVVLVVLAAIFGFGALVASFGATRADAAAGDGGFVNHPGLVPEVPQRNYPITLTTPLRNGTPRQTLAIDMIGNYIVSGGDFQQIQLPGGGTVNQPYLAIYDSRDRSLACQNLDVDDEVLSIAPGPRANTAVIGGRFDRVTGSDGVSRVRNKIALIDLANCSVDREWIVNGLNGRVTELAVTGNRLFVGGDFTNVEGSGIDNLFEVSLDSSNVNRNFDPNFGGALGRAVVGMEASPNGTRLAIVHRAASVMGNAMRGTAIFNISNPSNITLTNHRLDPNAGFGDGQGSVFDHFDRIQDGTISPDFSTIVIAQGPGEENDYVTAVTTAERTVGAKWQLFMRDTTFSAAATNDVVYVAGHFCRIDRGPGNGAVLGPNGGPNVCDGLDQPDGAFRTQIAALDLDDGTPLNWNPGNNALVGARALTVVNRGLLVGFDGDRVNDIRVGTTGFFDFGGPAIPDPTDPRDGLRCTASVNGSSVNISWNRLDGVTDYVVRRNSSWIASPGNVTSYTDTPPSGTHTYFIRTRFQGVQRDVACGPTVTIAPTPTPAPGQTQTCTATGRADGTVLINWTAIAGENDYSIRRNGRWFTDVSGSTQLVHDPGPGIHTYVVRSRQGGGLTVTTCNPTVTVAAAGGGGGPTCTATVRNDGAVQLNWSSIAGENQYNVRRGNGWVATVNNATSFLVTNHSPGQSYIIRSEMGGTTTNVNCT